MHISVKTGYAVRALSELALNASEKPISISKICEKQNLPIKYIEQLFRNLKRDGLVKSIHGSKGGYLLNRELNKISLKNIMKAVDDDFSHNFCYGTKEHIDYCKGFPCGFYELWDEIKDHMENYLDSIKLEQIISRL
ncbi:MAG: Rrf2 family transcriptional regulator [Candidatus Cloacimonetes bacterium]|nr:Rrf2 family transcriptional regulator [Candidatus Cloacimonadota bacterium]